MIYRYGFNFWELFVFIIGFLVICGIAFLIIRAIVKANKRRKWFKEHPDAEYYIPDNDN